MKQTTTIKGKRVTITTSAKGKVTIAAAAPLEWELQAAAVRLLRAMPEYVDTARKAKPGTFALAGDFNAGRRGPKEAAKAKATGLTAGEFDLRVYLYGGVLGLIEFKAEKTRFQKEQKPRHELLAALGFTHQSVVRASSCDDAARQAVELVCGWLVTQ